MSEKDGYLTQLVKRTGLKDRYSLLKWSWIGVSIAGGIFGTLIGWLYFPNFVAVAAIIGALAGAGAFAGFLKTLVNDEKTNRG